jgi:DivIVA domain-containing protein
MTSPKTGYSVSAVDAFIARAQGGESSLTSSEIRWASFPIVKGGYSVSDVDTALERLEISAIDQERRELTNRLGADGATNEARTRAQDILNRVAREPKKRFRTAAPFTYGYNKDDVDAFCDRVRAFYNDGGLLTHADVRGVTFRPRVGGYDEAQVDFLLDELVQVMLAAR